MCCSPTYMLRHAPAATVGEGGAARPLGGKPHGNPLMTEALREIGSARQKKRWGACDASGARGVAGRRSLLNSPIARGRSAGGGPERQVIEGERKIRFGGGVTDKGHWWRAAAGFLCRSIWTTIAARSDHAQTDRYREECALGQPQLPRNSTWFRILTVVVVARMHKMRRNCSPTENRCCGARIIPACSRPAPTHCV